MADEQHDRGHESGEHADHEPDDDELAEHGAEQQAELHVSHAHAFRVGEERSEEEGRGAERREDPLQPLLGMEDELRGQDDPAEGRTILSGRMRRSTSIAERTTRLEQKNAVDEGSPVSPKRRKQAATRNAVSSSTAG